MKRSFTMFPQVMTVVGSYMHPVGQAAGRPICWIEEAFAFALTRDLFFLANISIFTYLPLHLHLLDWAGIFFCKANISIFTDLPLHLHLLDWAGICFLAQLCFFICFCLAMHWAGICRHVWLSLDQVSAGLCIAVVQGIPFKWRLCKIYWSDRWVFRVGFFHLQTASNQTTWIASVTNRANGRGWRLLLYPAQLNFS